MTNRLLKQNTILPTLQLIRLGHKTQAKNYAIDKAKKKRYQAVGIMIIIFAWILTALMLVGLYNLL